MQYVQWYSDIFLMHLEWKFIQNFDTKGKNKHSLIHIYSIVLIKNTHSYLPLSHPQDATENSAFFLTLGQMLQYCTMIVLFLKIIM